MSLRSVILSPYIVGVGSRIGAQLNGFILLIVASRALDLGEFGSYALGWAVLVIFTTLVYTGIYHVLLRARAFEQSVDTCFWLQMAMGATGTLTMGLAGFIAWEAGAPLIGFALMGLAPLAALGVIGAWNEAQLMREERIRLISLSHLASELLALAVAVSLFRVGFGVGALIASRYTATLFWLALSSSVIRRMPRLRFSRPIAMASLTEAWPLWGSASLGMMSHYGADLILGAFLSPAAVGAYRVGARVANTAADVILQPITTISWARFARLEVMQAESEIRTVWKQNMALGFALIAPVMVSVSALSETIIATLFDDSWAAVATIVSILAIGRIFDSAAFLFQPTMTCVGRGKLQFYVHLGRVILLIALLLAFGRSSGEAAATSVVVTAFVTAVISLGLMMRAIGLSFLDLLSAMMPGLALIALYLAAIYLLDHRGITWGPSVDLMITIGTLGVIWFLVIGSLLRFKVLALPNA